jgi:hypothetical protein
MLVDTRCVVRGVNWADPTTVAAAVSAAERLPTTHGSVEIMTATNNCRARMLGVTILGPCRPRT